MFRPDRSNAASAFFEWINAGSGRLIVGGKLRTELGLLDSFREWQREAILAGRIRNYSDDEIEIQTGIVKNTGLCRSDDEHIITLVRHRLGHARHRGRSSPPGPTRSRP